MKTLTTELEDWQKAMLIRAAQGRTLHKFVTAHSLKAAEVVLGVTSAEFKRQWDLRNSA